MLMLGEEFLAAGGDHAWLTVGGPVQVEGDAPNRFFAVRVRNTGDHSVDVIAEESLNGTSWTRALTQGQLPCGVIGLAERCENGFLFLVQRNLGWWRLRANGNTQLAIKVSSMQDRAPVNA